MTERERLIELIPTFCKKENVLQFNKEILNTFADYLLENGVIVPPCKVGDNLYKPWKAGGKNVVAKFVVTTIASSIKDEWIVKYQKIGSTVRYQVNMDEIGKTIFLTKEEAEQALTCQESRHVEKGGSN